MRESRQPSIIKLFNTIVYPLTIACLGFILYKSIIGDYDFIYLVAAVVNIIALLVYSFFAKREFRMVSFIASIILLASVVWLLYLVSLSQLLVLVLLIPYLAWSMYSIVIHFRSIRRHPHPA